MPTPPSGDALDRAQELANRYGERPTAGFLNEIAWLIDSADESADLRENGPVNLLAQLDRADALQQRIASAVRELSGDGGDPTEPPATSDQLRDMIRRNRDLEQAQEIRAASIRRMQREVRELRSKLEAAQSGLATQFAQLLENASAGDLLAELERRLAAGKDKG